MKTMQRPRPGAKAKIAVAVLVLVAVIMFALSLRRAREHPSTDDATIDADVVHVASLVGGRIVSIPVQDGATVKRGSVLFQIDAFPYQAAVTQAEADLALARAGLGTQGRAVATQTSVADVSDDQVRRAEANQRLAASTVERLRPLAAQGYVPRQQLDQAELALRDATTSLAQARTQKGASRNAIDTVQGATAAVQAREAALALARRALADTTVRAPQRGRVVGLSVLAGEVVAPSQALFTLVVDDPWYAVGNFREGELRYIHPGQCATVYSMIDRKLHFRGEVESISSGVLDTDRVNLPRSVPYVEKSVNWVRVAQRFPVRIRLDAPPPELVRLGASAVVEVAHGPACR